MSINRLIQNLTGSVALNTVLQILPLVMTQELHQDTDNLIYRMAMETPRLRYANTSFCLSIVLEKKKCGKVWLYLTIKCHSPRDEE